MYIHPNKGFNGTDEFKFKVSQNKNKISDEAKVTINISPMSPNYVPIISDPSLRPIIAFVISFIVVTAVIYFSSRLISKFKWNKYPDYKPKFTDIIRTPDWDPKSFYFSISSVDGCDSVCIFGNLFNKNTSWCLCSTSRRNPRQSINFNGN